MTHRRFLGDREVLRVRTKGVEQGYVLVKLKPKRGGRPQWKKMDVEEYAGMVRYESR